MSTLADKIGTMAADCNGDDADAVVSKDHGPKYSFNTLDPKFCAFSHKDLKDKWLQWDMKDHYQALKFSFDSPFSEFDKDNFMKDFFNDPSVQDTFKVIFGGRGGGGEVVWGKIGAVESVQAKRLSTNILSLDFFDRLADANLVRGEGHIQGCMEEPFKDVMISHKIMEALLVEESEAFPVFDDADRNEFIFHLFKRVILGGGMNQYDDVTEYYLNATKLLYKDFVSVAKDPKTKAIGVASFVYEIHGITAPSGQLGGALWREPRSNNFCYLSIDPKKHTVSVFYHAALSQW